MNRSRLGFSSLVLLASVSCGGAPPPEAPAPPPPAVDAGQPAATLPPDGPIPTLNTGDLPPVVGELKVAGAPRRLVSNGVETLAFVLDDSRISNDASSVPVQLSIRDGKFAGFAFLKNASQTDKMTLFIRRPADAGAASTKVAPIEGALLIAAATSRDGSGVGLKLTFRTPESTAVSAPTLETEWAAAAQLYFQWRSSDFDAYATDRFMRWATAGKKVKASDRRQLVVETRDSIGGDVDLLSGGKAVNSALALEHVPKANPKDGKPVAASTVKNVELPTHPWASMTRGKGQAKPEPLADTAPADFYYVRARDYPTLSRALDQMDNWGTAASHIAEGAPGDAQIATRYETMLGVQRSELAKMFGSQAVGQMAIVGSDPYLAEGADVTMILEVKSQGLIDAALAQALNARAASHGEVAVTTRTHGAASIEVSKTADGAVHRERANLNGLVLLSNSPNALDTVLDTIAGSHPKLQSEPDFKYALARDASTPDALLMFLGDRFFGALTSPRTRILESRRRVAAAELSMPAYAALLYGWLEGKSPATSEDLVKAKLLDKTQLTHTNGGPITFVPGTAPRSSWGTPGNLVPLIDLPTPATYTHGEASSYASFAQYYRGVWTGYIDPTAVRIAFDGAKMNVDVRQMPIPFDTDYRKLEGLAGDTRIDVPSRSDGARFTVAIGHDARLRHEATSFLRSFTDSEQDFLDWLGDSATIGVLDRSELASSTRLLIDPPEKPAPIDADASAGSQSSWDADEAAVMALPIYVSIDVSNPITAGLVMAFVHKELDKDMPGTVHWDSIGKEGDASIVRIRIDAGDDSKLLSHSLNVFYAFAGGALDIALDEAVLRTVIRNRKDGEHATTTHSSDTGAQHILEIASQPKDGLSTAIAWLAATGEAQHGDALPRAIAESFFRGAPEKASDPAAIAGLAQMYVGYRPLTEDDTLYTWSDEGVVDPMRGSGVHPRWPSLPVSGSPIAKVLASLARLRTEIGFDDESARAKTPAGRKGAPQPSVDPNENLLQSLHARAIFTLR